MDGKKVDFTANDKGEKKYYAYHTASSYDYKNKQEQAKKMRRNPTEAEALMWCILRRNFHNYHFRRQHIIGEYIADFVCIKEQLVIEIDGEYHNDEVQRALDNQRSQFLNANGFRVLRFTNNDVLFDTDNVTESILLYLKKPNV